MTCIANGNEVYVHCDVGRKGRCDGVKEGGGGGREGCRRKERLVPRLYTS